MIQIVILGSGHTEILNSTLNTVTISDINLILHKYLGTESHSYFTTQFQDVVFLICYQMN